MACHSNKQRVTRLAYLYTPKTRMHMLPDITQLTPDITRFLTEIMRLLLFT